MVEAFVEVVVDDAGFNVGFNVVEFDEGVNPRYSPNSPKSLASPVWIYFIIIWMVSWMLFEDEDDEDEDEKEGEEGAIQ